MVDVKKDYVQGDNVVHALRSVDLVSRDGGPDTAAHCLVSNLLQVSAKLAGALNGCGTGYEAEAGFILAVLKRCLNWLNEAMAACQALLDQESDGDQKQATDNAGDVHLAMVS